jgi:hypothetical protein
MPAVHLCTMVIFFSMSEFDVQTNLLSVSFLAQMKFQERVVHLRQAEYDRQRVEREDQIQQMLQAQRQEREAMRKKIFYVRNEEEKQRKLREEEEPRKREGIFCYKITYIMMLEH